MSLLTGRRARNTGSVMTERAIAQLAPSVRSEWSWRFDNEVDELEARLALTDAEAVRLYLGERP